MYSQHIERDGKLLFKKVCERNLEGIVAKQKTGVYAEHGWLKIKNPNYSKKEGDSTRCLRRLGNGKAGTAKRSKPVARELDPAC